MPSIGENPSAPARTAEQVALEAMWKRLGFSDAVASAIDDPAVIGYQTLGELIEYSRVANAASKFCKNLRYWKGADGKEPYSVSAKAERNLQLMFFFLRHKARSTRTMLVTDITLPNVNALALQMDLEDQEGEKPPAAPAIDEKNWVKTFEKMAEYLGNFRGLDGTCLSYVCRMDLIVKPDALDPAVGELGSKYSDYDEEAIGRALILTEVANANAQGKSLRELEEKGPFNQTFLKDTKQAWQLIAPIFKDHLSWVYFKAGYKTKNARLGLWSVRQHYMGADMVNYQVNMYENEISSMNYLGEHASKNFDFERYSSRQLELHQLLNGLTEQGYHGIDERTKVRYFLNGLKHESMIPCKLHINSSPEIRSSFDACVRVCKAFLQQEAQQQSAKKSLHIAALNAAAAGDGGVSVEDQQLVRWYEKPEWLALEKSTRDKITKLRKQFKSKGIKIPGEPTGGMRNQNKKLRAAAAKSARETKKLRRTVSKLSAKVAAVTGPEKGQESSSDSDEEASGEEGAEYPPTRQGTRKKKKKRKMKALRTVRVSETKTDRVGYALGECNAELDSHADTTVLGKHCLVVGGSREPVDVYGWSPGSKAEQLEIVSAAVLYTHPVTGQRFILEFHHAIHHPTMEHHLINPMQVRFGGHEVNETPKCFKKNPTEEDFALKIEADEEREELIIPFELTGVTAHFPVRKPTSQEFEDESIPHIDMTERDIPWDPEDRRLGESEAAMTDFRGRVVEREASSRGQYIAAVTCDIKEDEEAPNSDYSLLTALNHSVQVKAVASKKAPNSINPMDLVKRWKISPKTARKTVEHTTCRMQRTLLHPSLSRRFKTNDRMLRYKRLQEDVFGDTMFSKVTSWKRMNKCAQVFGTRIGWARAYPMRSKGEAHEALSQLFTECGVPTTMIVDQSKEQLGTKFSKKCSEAQCRLKALDAYSPWSNAAEGTNREVKKGSRRIMIHSGAPKQLWDHALELQALIMSHTSNEHYLLNGEVPETYMTGETADISQISEFGFYQWVMFRDSSVSFPEDDMVLGRWLGPSRDVGPAMSAKILKANGEVVHRSTFRELTLEERESEVWKKARDLFDASIQAKIGAPATDKDFEDQPDSETPTYLPWEGGEDDKPLEPPSEEEKPYFLLGEGQSGTVNIPTPEEGDEFVNATIMLPRGEGHSRGRVVSRKRDEDGNPIGRRSERGFFQEDDRVYLVEFADGEVTELTANVIAQTMYANCDAEGNEYLLLDSILDWRKTDEYIAPDQQRVTGEDGKVYVRRSTQGVELCCKWRDESTSFQPLSLLKESHPVEVAEFAVAMGIEDEPCFNWWVKPVLKRRDRIISAVN